MAHALRHGDVSLHPTDKIPEGATEIKTEMRHVIQHGETGHKHVITKERETDIEMFEKDGEVYIKVNRAVPLSHEEHRTLTVEPGIYIKKIEREYDPFEKQLRKVID